MSSGRFERPWKQADADSRCAANNAGGEAAHSDAAPGPSVGITARPGQASDGASARLDLQASSVADQPANTTIGEVQSGQSTRAKILLMGKCSGSRARRHPRITGEQTGESVDGGDAVLPGGGQVAAEVCEALGAVLGAEAA